MTDEKNPIEQRQEILAELVETSGKLQKVALPTLLRPAVNSEEPATFDLVVWASRMYCYSVLATLREMLESFVANVTEGRIPASHLIARFMFELAGHAFFVREEIVERLKQKDYEQAWEQLSKINMGSSDRRRARAKEENDNDLPPFPDPYSVGKYMAPFFQWHVEQGRSVKTFYTNLSERSHPTMASLSAFY